MSTPPIPSTIPQSRLRFLTTMDAGMGEGMEAHSFCYLTDSKEWVVEEMADRDMILKQYPEAKFFEP